VEHEALGAFGVRVDIRVRVPVESTRRDRQQPFHTQSFAREAIALANLGRLEEANTRLASMLEGGRYCQLLKAVASAYVAFVAHTPLPLELAAQLAFRFRRDPRVLGRPRARTIATATSPVPNSSSLTSSGARTWRSSNRSCSICGGGSRSAGATRRWRLRGAACRDRAACRVAT
jgi:hypothetical protein